MKISKKGRNPGVVDSWLDNLGLYRKNVAYDETCLFRAISEQLFHCQIFHERTRKEVIEYGRNHYHEFSHLVESDQEFFEHLDRLKKHMVICGNLEIHLISRKYNRDVIIFHANQHQIYDVTKRNMATPPLMLCLLDEDHYDAVYQKEHITNAGFCQSIVYKTLYEGVFHIPNVDNIVNAMLYEKAPVINQLELEEKQNKGEELLTSEELANAVIAPFPFKVAKALDPTIYRNIEYDSWGEVRRELRLGDWYYGDDKLKLGTRCILKETLINESYDCYIQEILKDQKDKCVVYLTKLAEKRVVNYSDLSPESDAKPWPLPYRFSKNLSLAHNQPITQLASIERIKSIRKKNKEKRQNKSISEGTSPNAANSGAEGLTAYVGVPLQIQAGTSNNINNMEETSNTQCMSSSSGLLTPVTPDINTYPARYQWEQVQWPTASQYHHASPESSYYPITNPFLWPDTPTYTPHSSSYSNSPYNYDVKHMIASAPVTPNVVSYHDTNYPFYYNYHVEHYSPYPTQATSGVPTDITNSPRSAETQPAQNQQADAYAQAQGGSNGDQLAHRPLVYTPSTPQPPSLDMYHQNFVPMPQSAPILYTSVPAHQPTLDGVTDSVMPTSPNIVQSPSVMYTPPIDVQYVAAPAGYVYSPTHAQTGPTWYAPAPPGGYSCNSHGFVFPQVNGQN